MENVGFSYKTGFNGYAGIEDENNWPNVDLQWRHGFYSLADREAKFFTSRSRRCHPPSITGQRFVLFAIVVDIIDSLAILFQI